MAWSDAARQAAIEARRMHAVHTRAHGWSDTYWFKTYKTHVKMGKSLKAKGIAQREQKYLKQAHSNFLRAQKIAARYRMK